MMLLMLFMLDAFYDALHPVSFETGYSHSLILNIICIMMYV